MSESIYRRIALAEEENRPFWLVTVVATSGSTPATLGMKMLVFGDGAFQGTVGGGTIENQVRSRVVAKKPRLPERWKFDMEGDDDAAEKTGMECGGTQEMLVEPLGPVWPLVIVGGGHCGMALSALASRSGFSVTVLDDRPEWASKAKHPDARVVTIPAYDRLAEQIEFGADLFLVIMTHNHQYDELALRHLLGKEYRYLGMIGSDRKVDQIMKRLRRGGFSQRELQRVYAPIGFAIGSHAPFEIAVSILAQMIAVRNGVSAVKMNSNPFSKK